MLFYHNRILHVLLLCEAVNSLDVPGLMGRSVADLIEYFRLLVGWDPLDSTSHQLLAGWDPLDSTIHQPANSEPRGKERRLRIGVPHEYVCQARYQVPDLEFLYRFF
jgi:Asp-tRNA(Asn)/Glu-tRNA(Gln) amidotransferase A subunit family amidase